MRALASAHGTTSRLLEWIASERAAGSLGPMTEAQAIAEANARRASERASER
jgi:hypothetical protein